MKSKSGNIEIVKQMIEQIKYGILKISNVPSSKDGHGLMFKTLKVTDDGHVWCSLNKMISFALTDGKNRSVELKYIQKAEGLFIKLSGSAEVVKNSFFKNQVLVHRQNIIPRNHVSMLKVKIVEWHCYKKRSTSPFTSFLQAIDTCTSSNSVFDSAVY